MLGQQIIKLRSPNSTTLTDSGTGSGSSDCDENEAERVARMLDADLPAFKVRFSASQANGDNKQLARVDQQVAAIGAV